MSAADNLRTKVNNTINTTLKDKSFVQARHVQIQQSGDKNLNATFLRASIAAYRASTDTSYTIKPELSNDYAAAIKHFSTLRGIEPETDGQFKPETLNKELSPLELMKHFAKETHLKTVDADGNRDKDGAIASIKEQTKAIYGDESGAPAPTPEPVQTMSVYMTDDEFYNASEEAQAEYLATLDSRNDSAEKNRLVEGQNKKGKADEAAKQNAGEFEGLMENPDFGHKKDDDDFKIEQGDIIEYLMKEVILKSTAWTANRICGGTGLITYELLSAACKRAKPYVKPHWEAIKDAPGKAWDWALDNLFGPKPEDDKETKEKKEQSKKNLDEILAEHERNRHIAFSIEALNNVKEKNNEPEGLKKLKQNIITHNVFIEEDGVHFSDPTKPVKQFKDYCPDGASPEQIEALKALYLSYQERFDTDQITRMNKELNPSNDATKQTEIQNWYKDFKDAKKNNNPEPGPAEFINAQKKAQDATFAFHAAEGELALLNAQTKLFAEEYAMFKLLEKYRKDPLAADLLDKNQLATFMEQQKLEATAMFLDAEQRRGKGEKIKDEKGYEIKIPSREELIERATKLKEASREAIEKNQKTVIEDKNIAPILDPSNQRQDDPQTMIDNIKEQRNYDNFLEGCNQNLFQRNAELRELEHRQSLDDKKREELNTTKERLGFNKQSKKDAKDHGVDGTTRISPAPIPRGRS